jgi:hypothetical protein
MIRTTLLLAIVVAATVFLGCRRSQPPPRAVRGDAGSLAPVVVSHRVNDRSIIASAPPLPQAGAEATAPPAENRPAADNKPEGANPTDEKSDASGNEPAASPAEGSGTGADAAKPPAEPVPERPPKPAGDQTAKPTPKTNRGSDELDGVYTGPNMLRDR